MDFRTPDKSIDTVDNKQSAVDMKQFDKRIDVSEKPSEGRIVDSNVFERRVETENPEQQQDGIKESRIDYESERFQTYLGDVEYYYGDILSSEYKDKIKHFLDTHSVEKLTPQEVDERKRDFSSQKPGLIEKWEQENGKQWPRYEEDVRNSRGMIVRKKGMPYDAHHIIELSYGGPAETWNIVPLRFPDQHQNGIHKCESTLALFPLEKVYK